MTLTSDSLLEGINSKLETYASPSALIKLKQLSFIIREECFL